jgi:hypothetical protein
MKNRCEQNGRGAGRFAAGLILGLLLGAFAAAGAWNLLIVSAAPGKVLFVLVVVTAPYRGFHGLFRIQ